VFHPWLEILSMFSFKPAIWREDALYELPRPIVALRIQDAWDFARFKVPLRDGDNLAGHSRAGVDISLEGQLASQSGDLKLTEADMFAALEALRAALHVESSDDLYQFFLYHDPATSTYRSFKSCTTVRFDYDLGDKRLFTYSALIHAADPVIYTTPPA
jgi:hypothetical protein